MGTSGNTRGHAHLTWALSEAATLGLRGNAPGPKSLARVETKQDNGQALRILAHQLARAVYCLLKRTTACALEPLLRTSGSSASEPGASRATAGLRRHRTGVTPRMAASVHAAARLGPLSLRPAL